MPFDPFTLGGFNAAMLGSAGNANALQGMINQTTGAMADENYSRVAQAREQRRMDHEKELEAMRITALMARLQAEQAPRNDGLGGFHYDPGSDRWSRT